MRRTLTPKFTMLPLSPFVATNVFVRAVTINLCGSLFLLMCSMASAQSFTSTGATGAWNTSRWNSSADGPTYTSSYTANSNVSFTSGTYSFAGGMGGAINVGNITVASGVTVNFTTVSGTLQTAGTVRTIDVGSGGSLDFSTQNFSTAAGVGFIKNGTGVLALAGNTYTGGFTLNAGTVILRGVNAMGAGGALTLNGGTVAGSATRDLTGKYAGGITVGGNVQFGEMSTNVSLASDTANLTFSNNMALGGSTRTLTLGNGGNVALGGVISNTAGGVTFAATAGGTGRFDITNAANTFTGDINITGGEVRFTADGSLGNAANDIIIDGGRFATANSASYTLGAGRQIFVGDGVGTAISTPGSGTLTYNAAIADKSGETGSWAKQGGGILSLGGVSTYGGDTAINNGTVQLTTGSNRLPTGTTVSLGQAASANLGIFDLNGQNQQIAGLNSVTGTNATSSNNTVTSTTAATLTLGGGGTYSFGNGTDANSGVITGAIKLVKSGGGTQTFGEPNTYTGKTTISGGFIAGGGESIFGTAPGSFTADQITLNGGGIKASGSNIAFSSNRGITLGASGGFFDTNSLTITLTNVVAGAGALTKTGAGTLVTNGAHTYSGATNIQAGTLQLSAGNDRLPTGTVVNLGVASAATLGTLDLNGRSQTVAGLASVAGTNATTSNNVVTSSTAATLTLNIPGGTYTFGDGTNANSGVITGAISLVKDGAGTQILDDANTYTGTSTILGGVLQIGSTGNGKSGTGNLTVNGSTAVLAGNGTVESAVTFVTLGNIKPGSASGDAIGAMTIKHLTFTPVAPTTVAELQIGSASSFDFLDVQGDLTLNSNSNIRVTAPGYSPLAGDTFNLIDWSGSLSASGFSTGTNLRTGNNADGNEGNLDLPDISASGYSWQISNFSGSGSLMLTVVVPEPGRTGIAAFGLVLIALRRRRTNK